MTDFSDREGAGRRRHGILKFSLSVAMHTK